MSLSSLSYVMETEDFPKELLDKINHWKTGSQEISALIVAAEKHEDAKVYLLEWTQKQRLFRAVKALFIFWGLAIVSILIPLLHFILVPLFFLIGLIVPFFTYSKTTTILGGVGKCPFCSKKFDITATNNSWPLNDLCTHCRRHLQIIKSK